MSLGVDSNRQMRGRVRWGRGHGESSTYGWEERRDCLRFSQIIYIRQQNTWSPDFLMFLRFSTVQLQKKFFAEWRGEKRHEEIATLGGRRLAKPHPILIESSTRF